MYRIAICDDDKMYLDILEKRINQYCKYGKMDFVLNSFDSSELLADITENGKIYDAYLLDIEMNGYSGIDIAKIIHERSERTQYVGNIFNGSIMEQYQESEVVKKLKQRTPNAIEECRICPWKCSCQSGCANKNFRKYGRIDSKSDKCIYYKKYFEELIWLMDKYRSQYRELLCN